MSLLETLFTKYGTDKGIWGYTAAYEKYLEARRFDVCNVLEIGICGFRDIPNNVVGASLFAWRDYFPNAKIFGIDNDPRFIFNDHQRIHTALCDAYDPRSLEQALASFGGRRYDFICDDAVHDPLPQLQLINQLSPCLVTGGVYAIEEACPYKMPNHDLSPLIAMFSSAITRVEEFTTHKDERLIIGVR